MSLLDSPLSSIQLRESPKRFETLVGMRVEAFEALFEQVYAADLESQQLRHGLWTPARVKRMVDKYRPVLRE